MANHGKRWTKTELPLQVLVMREELLFVLITPDKGIKFGSEDNFVSGQQAAPTHLR